MNSATTNEHWVFREQRRSCSGGWPDSKVAYAELAAGSVSFSSPRKPRVRIHMHVGGVTRHVFSSASIPSPRFLGSFDMNRHHARLSVKKTSTPQSDEIACFTAFAFPLSLSLFTFSAHTNNKHRSSNTVTAFYLPAELAAGLDRPSSPRNKVPRVKHASAHAPDLSPRPSHVHNTGEPNPRPTSHYGCREDTAAEGQNIWRRAAGCKVAAAGGGRTGVI